jgi:4-amino-4-deoxy-L-arabinose transferase-like glycosyltransferase
VNPAPSRASRARLWVDEHPTSALWAVGLLALLARLAFLALEPKSDLAGDEPSWIALADREVLRLRRPFSPFRSGLIFYPPLYPYFLAANAWLFGAFDAARITQAVLGGVTAAAITAVGTHIVSARGGLLAGLLVAFHPELLWFAAHYWSETLFMAFFWWAVERLLAAGRTGRAGPALLSGLLWGLSALTRETALYMAPLAAGHLCLVGRGARRYLTPVIFSLGLLLTVAPWTWRNHVVFGGFVPISTFGALNLWQGNSHLSRDDLYVVSDSVEGSIAQYDLARREARKAILARQPFWIFEKVRRETVPFWACCSEAVLHFERGAYEDPPPAAVLATFLSIAGVYALLLVGFLWSLRDLVRKPEGRFLVVLLLAYFAMHLAAYSVDRFRLPMLPVLVVGAAGALAGGWRPPYRWLSWAAVLLVGALIAHSYVSCLQQ